jgi:RHS repeat-associated protein
MQGSDLIIQDLIPLLAYYDSNLIEQILLAGGDHYDYGYDDLYRLTDDVHNPSAGGPLYEKEFEYDLADNRMRYAYGSNDDVYELNTLNQVTRIATVNPGKSPKNKDWHTDIGYDLNGNMTEWDADGDITSYEYDYENRLVRIEYPDYTSTEFVYDALGRRLKTVEKDSQGTPMSETRYVYDGLDLIAELDGNNAVIASYTHGPGLDDPLLMRYGGYDYFYHKNHLGSITAMTDISQNIVKSYEYDAFGNILSETGSLAHNPFTYTGREYHVPSGLYYYRARFYDPQLGRFITQDPIGHLGGMNLYVYVGNAPVILVDPLGLDDWLWGERSFLRHTYFMPSLGLSDSAYKLGERLTVRRADSIQLVGYGVGATLLGGGAVCGGVLLIEGGAIGTGLLLISSGHIFGAFGIHDTVEGFQGKNMDDSLLRKTNPIDYLLPIPPDKLLEAIEALNEALNDIECSDQKGKRRN